MTPTPAEVRVILRSFVRHMKTVSKAMRQAKLAQIIGFRALHQLPADAQDHLASWLDGQLEQLEQRAPRGTGRGPVADGASVAGREPRGRGGAGVVKIQLLTGPIRLKPTGHATTKVCVVCRNEASPDGPEIEWLECERCGAPIHAFCYFTEVAEPPVREWWAKEVPDEAADWWTRSWPLTCSSARGAGRDQGSGHARRAGRRSSSAAKEKAAAEAAAAAID